MLALRRSASCSEAHTRVHNALNEENTAPAVPRAVSMGVESEDTTGFARIEHVTELVQVLAAITLGMDHETAVLIAYYEEDAEARELVDIEMDRVLLTFSLQFDTQLTVVQETVLEALGFPAEALKSAMSRFQTRILPGTGLRNELTPHDIAGIDLYIDTLNDFRERVTGRREPIPLKEPSKSHLTFEKAAYLQANYAVWMARQSVPDSIYMLQRFTACQDAQTAQAKCEIASNAGLAVPGSWRTAVNEDSLVDDQVVVDMANAYYTDLLMAHNVHPYELIIGSASYAASDAFEERVRQEMDVMYDTT